MHSHKILTIQQDEPTSAFGQTLAHSKRNVELVEPTYNLVKLPELNPVSACRGIPTELTPRGQPCCFVKIL